LFVPSCVPFAVFGPSTPPPVSVLLSFWPMLPLLWSLVFFRQSEIAPLLYPVPFSLPWESPGSEHPVFCWFFFFLPSFTPPLNRFFFFLRRDNGLSGFFRSLAQKLCCALYGLSKVRSVRVPRPPSAFPLTSTDTSLCSFLLEKIYLSLILSFFV